MRRTMAYAGTLLWLAACGGNQTGGTLPVGAPPSNMETPSDAAMPATSSSTTTPADEQSPPQTSATPPASSMNQAAPATPSAMPAQTNSMAQATPTTQAMPMGPQGVPPPDGFVPQAMNQCGLHTKWPGDEYCISPPPPDKGFQLHIGPSNYDNPEAEYVLQPGEENVRTYLATSANDHDIDFYVRQYRMRPGAHHTIVRDTSTGRRLSGSDINQDQPIGGITAPENAGIGIPLAAHSPISVDHHAINTMSQPLLEEVWVNFWYVDPSKVTQVSQLLYDPGDITATVAPGADVVLGPYDCDIKQPGRLISMFGHVHASNVRFSAWRTRSGKRDLIYEAYHWEDPLWLEYSSLAMNKMPDPTNLIDGGWTGILDLQPGDTLEWECHEINQQDSTLTFTNQTYLGTMCIIIGDLVGTKCETRSSFVIDPSAE